MCSPSQSSAIIPYGMKLSSPYITLGAAGMPQMSLELQRAQLQDYTNRLSIGVRSCGGPLGLGVYPYPSSLTNPYMHHYLYKDPRSRFIHEEPKPNHSYIGLIAMGILSHRDHKLVLSDIYQYILDNYSYFRSRGPGWRNSIRHNLSLNDCFIKSGRSANGKGHYWAIHPANLEDFKKGDFRRRRAQRRVRKHMGLSVPDDEDDSPIPSPQQPTIPWRDDTGSGNNDDDKAGVDNIIDTQSRAVIGIVDSSAGIAACGLDLSKVSPVKRAKRTFDMESLLAPDVEDVPCKKHTTYIDVCESSARGHAEESNSDIDIVHYTTETSDNEIRSTHTDVSHGQTNINTDSENEETDKYVKRAADERTSSTDSQTDDDGPPRRMSAFRNTGTYGWGALPGYISNYQLMALAAGQRSLMGPVSNLTPDSVQRWQQTMEQLRANRLGNDHATVAHVLPETHQ